MNQTSVPSCHGGSAACPLSISHLLGIVILCYLPSFHIREKPARYLEQAQDIMLMWKYFIGWVFYQHVTQLSQKHRAYASSRKIKAISIT